MLQKTSFHKLLNLYKTRLPLYRKYCDIEIHNVPIRTMPSVRSRAQSIIIPYERKNSRMNKLDFLVINGPNLNLLGIREPEIYGRMTICGTMPLYRGRGRKAGHLRFFFQSNHEGAIIDEIHSAYGKKDGIIINAGAFTHYSYAILDALKAVALPTARGPYQRYQCQRGFPQKFCNKAGVSGLHSGTRL